VEHRTLVYAVLATLAPSYQKNVDSLVKGGVDGIEIDQLMDMIRAMVPEKDEPDIID
jgi:methionine synthase I (cobalamin-dependent)